MYPTSGTFLFQIIAPVFPCQWPSFSGSRLHVISPKANLSIRKPCCFQYICCYGEISTGVFSHLFSNTNEYITNEYPQSYQDSNITCIFTGRCVAQWFTQAVVLLQRYTFIKNDGTDTNYVICLSSMSSEGGEAVILLPPLVVFFHWSIGSANDGFLWKTVYWHFIFWTCSHSKQMNKNLEQFTTEIITWPFARFSLNEN